MDFKTNDLAGGGKISRYAMMEMQVKNKIKFAVHENWDSKLSS
jgi:hypothetical protein